ncbi:general transcription factor 3C polypeptide 3 [Pieris napi]|uniref:general transcription factor 3C polypeptide 3 n=1 Tax=Pieris napi TaxID=78633 RepID=UPI001FB9A36D|nr:general transcription factor 3C polypeptide 3 [Pieris napi]
MEDEIDAQDGDISNKMQLETELTSKFLSGQMSFAEYSSEWYSGEDEDEHENEEIVTKNQEPLQSAPTERRRRRLTRLTPALVGLMGEANLRFVRGDVEMAEKMCHEIIKQLPTASEPYQTLAQIYEHDVEKSLQFSLLAAHLSPTDSNEWLRLAAVSNQKNDLKQEMICYTQAIKADPHNFDIHMKRLDLLGKLEEMKYPLNTWIIARVKCYHKIVTCLPPNQGKIILKYARLATTLYHNGNEKEKAYAVMLAAYNKCPTLFTLEDLNIFLELLISQKEFQKCLDVFVASVGVDIEAEIQTIRNSSNEIEEQTNYIKCAIPNDLAIDLKCKLLVSFIHLGAIDLVQTLLNDFLTNDVEKAGDLYMDIEEAFSAVGYHEMAMKVLEPLVNTPNFDLGAVWLKYADCLLNLGRQEEAVSAFYKVLKHAPQHPEARRKLFHILEKKEQIEDAINVLQQDYKYVVSPTLLYEQCKVLKKYNMIAKYLEVAESLLCRSVTKYRHEEELKIACKQKAGVEQIHEFRTIRGENPFHENDLHFEDENFKMSPVEEWDLFKELLSISFNLKQYTTMQRLCYSALIIKSLQSHKREIEFYVLQACLLNKDYVHAFRFIRDIAQRNTTNRTWNLLSLVLHALEDMTHTKYVTRLFQKEERWVKNLFLGNNYLLSGRYLVALKYFLEYHEQFREPISSFLISITILSMAAQKTFDKHHNLILQSVSYMLTYKQLRKCDQEVYYNLGRLYQMLNINNLAIEYYQKALACKPIAVCSRHGNIDLKMETAYNLYILYKDHSPDMARKTMLQHLVI